MNRYLLCVHILGYQDFSYEDNEELMTQWDYPSKHNLLYKPRDYKYHTL